MSKWIHEDVYKDGPEVIVQNANLLCICSQAPTTRTEAAGTYTLADETLSSIDFFWTETSAGWELTTIAKPNINIDADGLMTHVAMVDDTRLLLVNITVELQLYMGNLINLPSWNFLIKKPA